jgi:tetratricopeptide (TPR) repeat protein
VATSYLIVIREPTILGPLPQGKSEEANVISHISSGRAALLKFVAIFWMLTPVVASIQSQADPRRDCGQIRDVDRAIRGCTEYIAGNARSARTDRKAHDNQVGAYNNRGVAYDSKGEHNRAIADFTMAIELNPKHVEAYNNRGVAYEGEGDHDRAIADFTKAIALDPKYIRAYNNRGGAFNKNGHLDRAIADYTMAIALDPKHISAYYGRGFAYEKMGDKERAIGDSEGSFARSS